MIGMTALLLATSISGTADNIFQSGMESGGCPDGRIVQSDVSYGGVTLTDVDVTLFENLWGGATTFWPGLSGAAPTILDFTKTGYLAAKFHTSADPASTLIGMFDYVSYPFAGGPHMDLSIAAQCADFSPEQSGCVALDVPPVDVRFVTWRFSAGNPFVCQLQPDTDYFVNVRFSDPTASAPQCSDDACPIPIQSNYAP